ncbi:glucose-6-phosphate isomerase [Aliikangiella sp. IMCC44359]|uniref:glucose-6-phosphate isomerase n=1 Tax=Aliikangiella sp. IMCC44359 TaxID=3459125 RepID=UPI00403B10D3
MINNSPQWKSLLNHSENDLKDSNISDLFSESDRFQKLSFAFDQLLVDFSKQKLTTDTLDKLVDLANFVDLKKSISQLLNGEAVNTTEERPALHTALRAKIEDCLELDGVNINLLIQEQLTIMANMIEAITLGHWRGYSGKPITDVVNLGVGGSDLGPLLVCEALHEFKKEYVNPVNVHFASTMDGSQVSSLFERLNPETTVFVLVSKSFTTIDTLSNAASAKAWLMNHCESEAIVNKQHFIGISTSEEKMSEWGIAPSHQLKLWDWVGGRFSLWSTVGLTIALKIGMENFRALLNGANALDEHFRTAEFKDNIPVLLGLVGVWNTNFLDISAQAILPYDARLKYFPNYLTQLEMESNGKSVTQDGNQFNYDTCPVLWGEVGPNAQHAFYQLLHQGTRKVACDFIAPIKRFTQVETEHDKALREQHALTLANCFAQSRALMVGSKNEKTNNESINNVEEPSHKFYPGNQPSTTILLKELTPYSLGQLIALYEHKVFVMASIWGINPFDQWGVELGKTMAKQALEELKSPSETNCFDGSSNGLMNYIKEVKLASSE